MLTKIGKIFLNFLFLISHFIPKSKSIWIFSAWNGEKFSDNPRYLFEYLQSSHPEIRAVWISKNLDLAKHLHRKGIQVLYAYSLKGIFIQMRCGFAIYTHSVAWEFLGYLISKNTKRIQLWHGMPIKKIGLDDKKNKNNTAISFVSKLIYPYQNERIDMMIALGSLDKEIYAKAFDISIEKIKITGFPRNDEFFKRKLKQNSDFHKRIIYMPTFRGGVDGIFHLMDIDKFDYIGYNEILKKNNLYLDIRLHPVNKLSSNAFDAIKSSSNIRLVDSYIDIHAVLDGYDIYVVDFSSIYFDMLLTGKPIIIAALNINDYLNDDREGFYFSLKDLSDGKECYSWDCVFSMIIESGKYSSFTSASSVLKYHQYIDGNSSERVFKEIYKSWIIK